MNESNISLFDFLVDAAAIDTGARISPENNLDFYGYSQAAPFSVKLLVSFCLK